LRLFRDNLFGKPGVSERFSELLAVRKDPMQKVIYGFLLRSVVDLVASEDAQQTVILTLAGNEQPSETRDWMGFFAARIGNGHPEVVGHRLGSFRRGRYDTGR
jgi:hypothetical protein